MSGPVKMERRKAERVEAHLNLNVHLDLGGDGGSIEDLETINVSSSGIYFLSNRYIEPMTKLALSFDITTGDAKEEISCEGIVVRVQPEVPDEQADSYEVAVFFTFIDASSLRCLEDYLAARISD